MSILSKLRIQVKIVLLSIMGIIGMCLISSINTYLDAGRKADLKILNQSQETVRLVLERGAVEARALGGAVEGVSQEHKKVQSAISGRLATIQADSKNDGIRAMVEKVLSNEKVHLELFGKVVKNNEAINKEKAGITDKLKHISLYLTEGVTAIDAEELEKSMEGDTLDPTKGSLRMELKDFNAIANSTLINLQELFLFNDGNTYKAKMAELNKASALKQKNIQTLVSVLESKEITDNWNKVGPLMEEIKTLEQTVFSLWEQNGELSGKMTASVAEFRKNALEISRISKGAIDRSTVLAKRISIGTTVIGVLVLIVFSVLIIRSIVRPLKETVHMFRDIAEGEGDLTKRLDVSGNDEISEMAKWFNTFLDNLRSIIGEVTKNAASLNEASGTLAAISTQISNDAEQTADRSNTVAAAAEEMSTNMNSVSAAMEESSANLNTVSQATDQMTATVNEIARNTDKARDISQGAVVKVTGSAEQMNQLGEAAQAIGKVVETITDISEQVNLLSLNATIEAARAGEAGKGFAVVANEIKDLANQTANASMDIKEKIGHIQDSAGGSLKGMNEITGVIREVNAIVTTIASAVEEQSASSREIALNISQASTGIEEVNQNVSQSAAVAAEITRDITGVNQAAGEMVERSFQVNENASNLSGMATDLGKLVNRFKI